MSTGYQTFRLLAPLEARDFLSKKSKEKDRGIEL
jgi:hypothetical protein